MYVIQYNIRTSHLKHDVSTFLDSAMNERKNTNVVVMCSLACFKELMYQVTSSSVFFVAFLTNTRIAVNSVVSSLSEMN